MLDNRVEQRTVAQGLAAYTLDQVVSGRRSFATVFAHGDPVRYTVESTDGALFEINEGVLDTSLVPPRLSRGRLIASTTGSAIDWPDSSPKRIFGDADAELFGPLGGQLILAALDGASTVDAIVAKTAIKTPVLRDGMCVEIDLAGPNTVTTPSLKLNALAPKTIVRPDGAAIAVGYLRAVRTRFSYKAATDKWIALRPQETMAASQALANAGADDADFITALKLWATPLRGGHKNIVGANGGFEVWQRAGPSVAVPASSVAYTADRWYLNTNANQAHTVFAGGTGVKGSQFCAAIQRNAGQTGEGDMYFGFPLDTDEIVRIRRRKLSLRFSAATGANWSPTNGTLRVFFACGTGPVQKKVVGYTSQVNIIEAAFDLPPGMSNWADFNILLSAAEVPNTTTQAELFFYWQPKGAAGASDLIALDDVDLRAADPIVDQFERAPVEVELIRCRRFSHRISGSVGVIASGYNRSTTVQRVHIPFKTPMRVAPTSINFANVASFSVIHGTTSTVATNLTFVDATTEGITIDVTVAAGLTAGQGSLLATTNANATLVILGAEI